MNSEKIKGALAAAAAGGVAVALIGFVWGGWITSTKAERMVSSAVTDAVVDRLAPMCVSNFGGDPNKAEKLQAMKKVDSWNRAEYVGKQGWATMAGEEDSDSRVARRCAELLAELKS